jgi:hypothetical protein
MQDICIGRGQSTGMNVSHLDPNSLYLEDGNDMFPSDVGNHMMSQPRRT